MTFVKNTINTITTTASNAYSHEFDPKKLGDIVCMNIVSGVASTVASHIIAKAIVKSVNRRLNKPVVMTTTADYIETSDIRPVRDSIIAIVESHPELYGNQLGIAKALGYETITALRQAIIEEQKKFG